MFTNVADEAMSASDSASFIIAQMKAFNIDASNAEHIIDAVNSVSNHYAVSSGQLAQNLGNMSAAMATGNNTFEQSLGMLTAMTEITRNAAKGSRALITVQGRLNQIVDESSDTGKALTKWYQEHKIAVKDDEGQIRSLYDVLTDVAKIWPTLTKNEQMYYLQQQAGTTQTQNLAALLSNYETAIKATNTAIESNGSAMQENERYMESLQAKEQALKAEFEDFSNRVLSQEFVGGLLDAGKAMLNFANNDVGAAITRIGAFSTSVVGVVGIIGTVVGKLSQLSSALSAAGGATGFLGTLLAPKTLLIIAGVAAAIAGIVEAVKAVEQAQYEADHAFEIANTKLAETKAEIDSTKESLDKYKDSLQQLNEVSKENRDLDWQQERAEIEMNITATENYLKLLEQRARLEAETAYASKSPIGYSGAESIEEQTYKDDFYFGDYVSKNDKLVQLSKEQADAISASYDSEYEALTAITLALSNATDERYRYIDAEDLAQLEGLSSTEQIAKMTDWLDKLGIVLSATTETSTEAFNNMSNLANKTGELSQKEQDLAQRYLATYRNIVDLGVATKDQVEAYIQLQAKMTGVLLETGDAVDGAKNGLDELAEASDAVVQKATSVADSIVGEVTAVDTANQAFVDLVAQEIIFNNNDLDVSQKLTALSQLAQQAGYTAQAIASIQGGTAAQYVNEDQIKGYMRTHGVDRATAENALLAEVWKAGSAGQQVTRDVTDKAVTRGGGSGSVKKSIDKTAEYAEKKAKEAAEKAAQEAEQAAKEAAEKAKEQINKTFDELKEAEEAYWDAKIDALETQNKLIDRQTRLEEKLKALQEAKQKKILLYKDGRFQYSEDVGAIASAQQDYNETWRDIYVEEQTEILNDLKDKALAIIEEYRDKALENGELTQENINSLLSEYHELGNNTYQTVAYGVENITNIVASGMSALTGSISGATSTATSAISGTMGTIGSSMSKMATGLTSAASLLNKQFGEGLSAILKTSQVKSGKMVGTYQLGENEQTLDDFRNEYWGDTSGKFSKLSLLYGGGQAWWLGMMSKYLEDPEKNANLKLGSMTLKELYDTDWTKKVGSASSLGEIDDYIAREQAKYILNGGSQSDYEALNKIAQDAYRELYFKNPRAYAPGAKGYGGYDPEFSAAQYAVDAALRYSGSNYDVFGVEGGRTSGMSAGRVSDLNFLRELVSQGERAGASSISQTQAEWAKNQLNERYQTSYKNTLDAIDKQIEENSKKWYTADAEERDRLHLLNEELRKNRGEYEKKVGGNANGTLSWRGGLSVVGEKGPELRVLNKGDGIIPSNITENLWKIGSDPSKFMRDVVRTTSNIFSISSLSLPNARDAQSLVDGLQELAHQYVAKRK